ncbi:MAG: hypothetical protein H6Q41_3542 [Deltaproteobacteria bacterium]|nr:hypothetical protein [Deltaproteobacteria bacterium]
MTSNFAYLFSYTNILKVAWFVKHYFYTNYVVILITYNYSTLYTYIHIGLILYFCFEKGSPFVVRHCNENLRKWEQTSFHIGRKKAMGLDLTHSAAASSA